LDNNNNLLCRLKKKLGRKPPRTGQELQQHPVVSSPIFTLQYCILQRQLVEVRRIYNALSIMLNRAGSKNISFESLCVWFAPGIVPNGRIRHMHQTAMFKLEAVDQLALWRF
jgi:hypothetical protein